METWKGKLTVSIYRKASVLFALRQESRTPPGSKSRACAYRGNSGTWENLLFPCRNRRKQGVPADQETWRSMVAFCHVTSPKGNTKETKVDKVSGIKSRKQETRNGQQVVLADHSTEGMNPKVHPEKVGD